MKKFVLIMICCMSLLVSASAQTLIIKTGTVPVQIKIIEGDGFVFPKDLSSYGLKLTVTDSVYIIEAITKSKSDDTESGIVIKGSVGNIISGSNMVINNNNGVTTVIGGNLKTLTITVPKSTTIIM